MITALLTSFVLAPTLTLPVRVDGDGYLRFVREGRIVYASSAVLTVQGGLLVSAKGPAVTPSIRIPANAIKLQVDLEGNVGAVTAGTLTACGKLVLAVFDKAPIEEQGFLVSATRARLANPGENGCGVIRSTSGTPTIAAALPPATAQIQIAPISEVEGDTVTLKDIATINADAKAKAVLEAVVVGPTPAIGIEVAVTAQRIKFLARRAGVEAEVTAATNAVLRRKGQTIKQSDFVAAAIKAAQKELGVEIAMTCPDNTADFIAPMGTVELRTENVTISGASAQVVIGVYVDGKKQHVNSRTVNLKADASAEIKAGAPVKIVMKSAGISVEMPGKTRTGGMLGQQVTVVTDTGTVLTGIVIGPDKVEVKL